MPQYILNDLTARGISFSVHETLEEVIPNVDILYMTRVQKERFDETEYQHLKSKFILTPDVLVNARENMKILHPLPRIDEIVTSVDKTPYAYYFNQAAYGVFAREAILSLVLNKEI